LHGRTRADAEAGQLVSGQGLAPDRKEIPELQERSGPDLDDTGRLERAQRVGAVSRDHVRATAPLGRSNSDSSRDRDHVTTGEKLEVHAERSARRGRARQAPPVEAVDDPRTGDGLTADRRAIERASTK